MLTAFSATVLKVVRTGRQPLIGASQKTCHFQKAFGNKSAGIIPAQLFPHILIITGE